MFSKILRTEILNEVKYGFYGFSQQAFYGKKSYVLLYGILQHYFKGYLFPQKFLWLSVAVKVIAWDDIAARLLEGLLIETT